jgi:hypothetical protein
VQEGGVKQEGQAAQKVMVTTEEGLAPSAEGSAGKNKAAAEAIAGGL